MFAYAGNNPVRYIDPDGRKLDLYLNKETQTLTVVYQDKNFSFKYTFNSSSITTRVEWGVNNRNVNENSHLLQSNNTKPTQFPNGDWNITGEDTTSDSKYGDKWLTTDAFQMLDVYSDDMKTIVKNPDGTNKKVKDSGYFIHFTTTNTHGCLGILSKAKMKLLLFLYNLNKSTSDPSAMIHVTGDPTKYDSSKDKNIETVSVEF